MGMTYELCKAKIKSEKKFTLEELMWMLEKIETMEKKMDKLEESMDERLNVFERAADDHIPGGI